MKINWAERILVNNFIWAIVQRNVIAHYWKKSVELGDEAVVLEIGCGRGAGSVILSDEFQPSRVDAFDLDEEMIGKAEDYIPIDYRERISLSVCDVKSIGASDQTYDAVFDFFTLHHVKDWEKGVSEVARVLKPGGYFAFGELYGRLLNNYIVRNIFEHPLDKRFEREAWVKALAENGLRLMENNRDIWGYGIIGVAKKIED
ncbi:MAG: methyltransferase domain-containing protein [Candidatus Altiarchaeales archaeon]|nr:methyltransferase domain-containing protein [Candidatus Altiarchaeales archaeon]MBD3416138.1 methyltransferase domain-containing protein [Candidatus Altiarchaeales archaeon]